MKQTVKLSFEDYFRELIGDAEAQQFFDTVKEKKRGPRTLRVNTLKITKAKLTTWLKSQGYEVRDSEFSTDGLVLEGRGEPLALKLPYHAGFTYPQDSASMFAVEVLDPQPGELAIDLTAAPGGKTTHIAQRMKNTGVLVANDLDSRRLKALHSNLERLGVWNTFVTRATPYRLSQHFGEVFDRVLLDPSCSGEGLLVTSDGKPDFWNKKALKRYSAEQFGLLCSAFGMLKPGGRLVYSTCTLNDVEDDDVVMRLLKKFPEAVIEDVQPTGAQVPEQIPRLSGEEFKGIRFWPHKTGTKGFFCVAITKTESCSEVPPAQRSKLRPLKTAQLHRFTSYLKKTFGCELPDANFYKKDNQVFPISKDAGRYPLPSKFSLALPLFELSSEEIRLTHSGATLLGLSAKTGVYKLSRDEVEAAFERTPIENSGEAAPELMIAKYKSFPVGVVKLTEKHVEVRMPRQA